MWGMNSKQRNNINLNTPNIPRQEIVNEIQNWDDENNNKKTLSVYRLCGKIPYASFWQKQHVCQSPHLSKLRVFTIKQIYKQAEKLNKEKSTLDTV